MRKLLLSLTLLSAALLLPPSSRAQFIVVGQACGASGLSGIANDGTPVVCRGNPLVWTGIGGGGGASGSIATLIDVTSSGVKADVKACFDASVTNGSPNISSAGQCQWVAGDVGKKVFVTSVCNATTCGFGVGMSSTTILPNTQTTVGRIASVTDATHIVVDCNAPGNCSSPNASATLANTAAVLYGDDDTTALNNAFASWTGTNVCPTFLFPRGIMFFNAAIFSTLPNLATNACTSPSVSQSGSSKFQNLGQAVGNTALTFLGQGPAATLFVPTPDFNFASCTTACMFPFLSPVLEDFGIDGFGQSFLGVGGITATLIYCNACVMQNVHLGGWTSRSSSIGLNFGGGVGFSYATNLYVEEFGGANGGVFTSGDANQITNSTLGLASHALTVSAGSNLNTSNNVYYGSTQFNAATVDIAGNWVSTGDRIFDGNLATGAFPGVKVEGTGFAQINGLLYTPVSNANAAGLSVVSGGKAVVSNWRTSISTLTSGGNIAGTLMGWGNDFGGPLTVTGNVVNAPSEQGTFTCATSTATITFHSPVTYRSNPVVLLTDNTTAGGARISAENTTTATVTCTGASDTGVYSVTPNPN